MLVDWMQSRPLPKPMHMLSGASGRACHGMAATAAGVWHKFCAPGSSTTRRWKPPAPVSDESVIGFTRDGHPTDRLPTHPRSASPQRDFGRAFSYEERSCARSDLTTERRRRGSKNSPDSATKAAKESSVKFTLVYVQGYDMLPEIYVPVVTAYSFGAKSS